MGTTAVPFLLLLVACQLQNFQGSAQCGSSSGRPCIEGCWYKTITQRCEQCHGCTERGLADGHPAECRHLDFPSYCSLDANGNDIATVIPTVDLPDNVQGNFSLNKDKWAVFFFREEAEENPGVTYSRVGKVCRHEWHKNSTEWVTFQKARLVCSSEAGVEYNYLEHIITVTMTTDSKSSLYFYGVFAKSRLSSKESALCGFTAKSVLQVMRGSISDPLSERIGTGHTFPVQDQYMPTDWTPGMCNGASLNDWQKTFIRTHPLMFYKVEKEILLTKGAVHFTKLASDTQVALSGESCIVLFIGTVDGRLLKLVRLQNGDANILEELMLTPVAGEITHLEIIHTDEGKMVRALSAGSDEPVTVPVQRCVNMSACACPQDPYCAWNLDDNVCKELNANMSGDRFNQSVEEKHKCDRNGTHPALLTTSYRILPTTMKPSTTREEEGIEKVPPEDSRVSKGDVGGVHKMVIPILCLLVCIAIITIIAVVKYKRRRYQPVCCANVGDGVKIVASWTTITLEGKLGVCNMSEWQLKNSNVEPVIVKSFMGKTKTLKFEGLTPLTPYVIVKDSGLTKEVTTDGPKLKLVDGSITKTSIPVKVSNWNEDFNGVIKLTSEEQSREKSIINPSDEILIDGLLPNVEYTIHLEVKHRTQRTTSFIQFGTVKTKEEEFQIESQGETCILRWIGLPRQISELIISTCCSPSEFVRVDAREGCAVIEHLCHVEDLIIKVKGKLESSEYEIASLCHDARPSGACADLSCLSTMRDLKADIQFRKSLAMLMSSRIVYLKYCETFGYSREEGSAHFKVSSTPEDKFLAPLHDRNEEQNLCIFVKALVSNFEDLFNSISSSNRRDLQECSYIFNIIQKLATFNPSCEACAAIFRRVKHKWECQGLKSHLPQDC